MGRQHSLSGIVAGLAVAPLGGLTSITSVIPFAIVVAGFALAPDLDCAGATMSRAVGPLSKGVSWLLRQASRLAFWCSETDRDRHGEGVHRHLTHTIVFALVTGGIAAGTSLASPWVVAGWLTVGALGAQAASMEPKRLIRLLSSLLPRNARQTVNFAARYWPTLAMAAAVAIPVVIEQVPVATVLAPVQGWIGLAVGGGCLLHLAGDAITITGVPACWPIHIHRQAWCELHLLPTKIRLHTGKRFERYAIYPVLLVASAAGLWLLPDVRAGLPQLATTVQEGLPR